MNLALPEDLLQIIEIQENKTIWKTEQDNIILYSVEKQRPSSREGYDHNL